MGKKNRITGFLIAGTALMALFLSACGGVKAVDVGIPAATEVTVYQSRF